MDEPGGKEQTLAASSLADALGVKLTLADGSATATCATHGHRARRQGSSDAPRAPADETLPLSARPQDAVKPGPPARRARRGRLAGMQLVAATTPMDAASRQERTAAQAPPRKRAQRGARQRQSQPRISGDNVASRGAPGEVIAGKSANTCPSGPACAGSRAARKNSGPAGNRCANETPAAAASPKGAQLEVGGSRALQQSEIAAHAGQAAPHMTVGACGHERDGAAGAKVQTKLIAACVAASRAACRMRYLNGAAPVCYGLPAAFIVRRQRPHKEEPG